jgi:two-component system response regulator YesN
MNMNILLVEDNANYRVTVKEALLAQFPEMNVHEASDGKEALRFLDIDPPTLIFMDINLRGESGLVMTRVIKEIFPQVPICILTNHDSPEYRKAAKQSRADFFLSKLTTKGDDLTKLVEHVADRHAEND